MALLWFLHTTVRYALRLSRTLRYRVKCLFLMTLSKTTYMPFKCKIKLQKTALYLGDVL